MRAHVRRKVVLVHVHGTIMPRFLELFTNPPTLHSRNAVVLDVVSFVELVLYMKRK